jgi:hypothetical protein
VVSMGTTEKTSFLLGETEEDGFPVVYSILEDLPPESRRSYLPHLMVISWKYDGAQYNGMPDQDSNQRILHLRRLLGDTFEDKDRSAFAYHRTGNGLKEFVYYVADTREFIDELNRILRHLPRFPIDITFYEDREWSDFQCIAGKFTGDAPSVA